MCNKKSEWLARCRTGAIVIAACAVGSQLVAPAEARERHSLTIRHDRLAAFGSDRGYVPAPVAAPILIPLGDGGVFFQTPFFEVSSPLGPTVIVRVPHYQGPDGTYDDLGDLSNEIQGTPCGQRCTVRSLVRWGYVPD